MADTRGIRAGRAFVELGVSDKLTAGLRRAQRRLKAFGDGVRSIGQRLVAVATVAAVPFALSSRAFASFEQSMARVRALTGAAEADFQRLAAEAKRLGETTVFSASQAAEAMGFFALAGFDVQQILAAIGPTLDLAAAGQLDLAAAADIATKIMAGMGIEADRLGGAVDVLTKAMTTANTDLQQLGDAMKFVGPIAKTAGIAFEEVVAAVQLLSNAGIQAEMAGTTLRGAILALTSPSKEAADKLQELGVRVTDAAGDVRPLADIIDDLNRAMDGLGTGQRLDVLGRLFPARTAAGVAELLAQGADKLRDYTAALGNAGGTAARIAAVQLNTLKGQVTILRSALEGLGIAVGESLGAPLRVATHGITRAAGAIAQWAREHRAAVVLAAASVAAIGAAGAALIALGLAAQVTAFAIGGLATVLTGVVAVLGAVLSPIGLAVAAVGALPGVVVVASGAAGAAIDWLRDRFAGLGERVSGVVSGMQDALAAGDVALAARVLWAGVRAEWERGTDALERIWIDFRAAFERLAVKAFSGLQRAWIRVRDWFYDNFPRFTSFMAKAWNAFTVGVQSAWATAQGAVEKGFNHLFAALDEDLDAGELNRMTDAATDQRLNDIEQRGRDANREADRRAQLTESERAREQAADLAAIDAAEQAALTAVERRRGARIAQAAEDLRQAQAELDTARGEAARRREEADADTAADLDAALADRVGELAEVLGAVEVRGTFNAAAIAGLAGAGSAQERTATATEQTARNTKLIVDAARQGLAFA